MFSPATRGTANHSSVISDTRASPPGNALVTDVVTLPLGVGTTFDRTISAPCPCEVPPPPPTPVVNNTSKTTAETVCLLEHDRNMAAQKKAQRKKSTAKVLREGEEQPREKMAAGVVVKG